MLQGDYSVAMGRDCSAVQHYGVAIGLRSKAGQGDPSNVDVAQRAMYCTSIGYQNLAQGLHSIAMGYDNTAGTSLART